MSGKGQLKRSKTKSEENKQELKEIKELERSLILGSNQSMIEGLNLEEEEEENKIEEEEKKEENDNSGGDNSGDGIPGGENPDPENNPDKKNDDVLKEESGSGSDGDSDDDEHKEFEINTSGKKKVAGVPQNPSKIILSSNKDAVSDDKDNAASEFETENEFERTVKIIRKTKDIKKQIKDKNPKEAVELVRREHELTEEDIKKSEAVPRMMDPYFRSVISDLSRDRTIGEEKRKAFEDFSEEMDQQMLINAMKAPGEMQMGNLAHYFRNAGDEKQLQREYKDQGGLKYLFGEENFNSYLNSWKNEIDTTGRYKVSEKREKELETQKESARSLFKIFLLMQIGELKQRDTDKKTGRKNETDWKHNVSDLFAHGGRVMITTGEREEAGTEDLVSSIFSKKSALKKRSAATHYITEGKEEPGTLEEKRGKKAALKGMFSSDWNNYGMPVAVGGSGNLGPDKKRAILNDNRNGHLYVGAKEAEKYKRGGILIGLEGEAPYRMNQWGHYHTAKATAGEIKPTGGRGLDLHGDKTSGRNLYLRDIKNEDLITIMNAVDKEFDKLYGGERKEEYEGILQKITGKKLEQKELETILKDLTGLEKLHIDLKKSIPNIQEEIKPEETESDDSLEGMFNSDIQLNPDENPKKDERYHVSVSGNVSKESLIEKLEADNEKGKNDLILNFLKYQTLKEKKEGEEKPEPTEEEKEKIKKFENRKRFEVDKDDDENQENEENPLKSEEFPSLANYGPILSEEEMDAIDPKAPDPDKEIIKERLEKEPLKQKGYVNEVGQEWLYDTDGSGKYYSAQADYTPDHFKDKKTAIDDSIFDMLSGLQEEKPEDTKEPNTEESSTEESNNHITGLGEMNIKKVSPVEPYNPFKDNKSETKEPAQNNVVKAANKEVKSEPPKITNNKSNNLFDLFGIKKSSESTEPNKGSVVKADHVEQQKKSVEEKKIEIKPNENINKNIIEKKPKVEKIKEQPKLKQIEPKQVRPEKKVSIKPVVKKEIEKKQKEETKEQLEKVKQKITQSEVKPLTGNPEKNKTLLNQDKTLIISNFENNKINNPNSIDKEKEKLALIDELIKNEDVLKMFGEKNLETMGIDLLKKIQKTFSRQPEKKSTESSQKSESTKFNNINNNINNINNINNNPKVVRTKRDELIDEIINNNILEKNKDIQVEDLFNMDENLLGDILANGINKITDNQPKSSQKIKFTNLNSINNKSKGQQKVIPDKSKQKIQLNNLKPSDADLDVQRDGNNCFAFVASALMRYYGKKNQIKGFENVRETDLLKQYGINEVDGRNFLDPNGYGKFGKEFSFVRNLMLQNVSMSMGDIAEAIHELSGGKVALNIKVIDRDASEMELAENNEAKAREEERKEQKKETKAKVEEAKARVKKAKDIDEERQKSLIDMISYVVETKKQPVGLLLGGKIGSGHYTMVTGLTSNGFKYKDSSANPQKEYIWTWEDLFKVHYKIQVCFLENADIDPSNQKNYKDISKFLEPKDIKPEDLPEADRKKLSGIEDGIKFGREINSDEVINEYTNKYNQELLKAQQEAHNEREAVKTSVFLCETNNSTEIHTGHTDFYLYDDGKRSFISLRPKKKP